MVGPPASWGPGVPTPGCLHQQGRWAITQLLGHEGGTRSEWWSPRLWLFGAARTQGKAHLNTGVPSLAVCQ